LKYINLTLKIQDNGVGISEDGIKKLFVNFGKLDENSSLNKEGTGLGLSICKSLIEQRGGTVNVKSKVGQGTIFSINLTTQCLPKPTVIKNMRLRSLDFDFYSR
jgi:signal transduction histidine kinase